MAHVAKASELLALVVGDGRRLEMHGDFDGAFERYLARIAEHSFFTILGRRLRTNFHEITNWAAAKDQSVDQIKGAIQELQSLSGPFQALENRLKSDYIVYRRFVQGDRSVLGMIGNSQDLQRELLWGRLMPWENDRAMRVLNQLTDTAAPFAKCSKRARGSGSPHS